jgi:hypothetical protein
VGSERPQDGQILKSWRFDLTAATAGTTQVVPVVYLESMISDPGGGRDSLVGEATMIIIDPPPGPARWPWFAGIAAVIGAVGLTLRAIRRNRFNRPERHEIPPPLQEALGMLDQAGMNCREDRANQYFADVAALICGYFARRLDRALPALTARELRPLIDPHLSDDGAVGELEDILRRCGEVRFGSRKVPFEELQQVAGRVRMALEQLDKAWVTDTRRGTPETAASEETIEPDKRQ